MPKTEIISSEVLEGKEMSVEAIEEEIKFVEGEEPEIDEKAVERALEKAAKSQALNENKPNTNKIQKKGRVFVKNLIFDISEKILRKAFGKYGEIIDVSIPLNPANNKPKGFAFVEFANKNHALKAIHEHDGKNFKGRPLEMRLAEQKERFLKDPNEIAEEKIDDNDPEAVEKKFEEKALDQDGDEDDDDEEKSKDLEAAFVDANDVESQEDPEDAKSNEEEDQESEAPEEMENELDQDEDSVCEKIETTEHPSKEVKKEEALEQTVFIRNIPLEVDEQDLGEFFSKMGKVFYARICMNQGGEDHKGTGFVKFKDGNFLF